ncbi:hypothetical protein LMG28138_03562 [Pararobbsia alpina]|uniref:Uncharacterized protein n=1 Tax=Pararobbsia alpina TaxID=621374 RepID=A0A6S7BSD2_9BURK|nr:hypothetical protein LMG28138_03562 [Pararobbsia alpina]
MFVKSFVTSKTRLLMSSGPVSLSFLLSLGFMPPALAQTSGEAGAAAMPIEALPSSSAAGTDQAAKADPTPPAPAGFWDRSNLFGDMGGVRPWLGNHGVTIGLQETSEYLNNPSGGIKRGGAYDGLVQLGIGIDMEKAAGLTGGIFNVSALQIHGSSLSQRNLLTLQSASGVEADDATRIWELWYQQSLLAL